MKAYVEDVQREEKADPRACYLIIITRSRPPRLQIVSRRPRGLEDRRNLMGAGVTERDVQGRRRPSDFARLRTMNR